MAGKIQSQKDTKNTDRNTKASCFLIVGYGLLSSVHNDFYARLAPV
jgi:hypothetical protein